MIKFIKNRDLIWDVEKYDVILVGCSIYNLLTQGFQAKLCVKYPGLKSVDGKTPYADKRKYGTRVSYDVNGQTISLMYICGYPYKNKEYINYDGFINCLATANQEYKGKGLKVACTIIGSAFCDGNGDREKCLQLIEEHCKDLDITIYDYEQLPKREEISRILHRFNFLKRRRKYDLYWKLRNNKTAILEAIYLKR